ncbi:abl interactor 2 isoform X1 [Cloeon dipterum]|uniref:abl interactor 2 isoform X1 n=2 Tax=Cloeon dipterum TaxID=197152 RepID=UPI00321FD403
MDFNLDIDFSEFEITLDDLPPPPADPDPDEPDSLPPPPPDEPNEPDLPPPPLLNHPEEPDLSPPPDILPPMIAVKTTNSAVSRMMVGARGGSELGSDTEHLAELAALLSTELPEGRASLCDSHQNLQRVAEYCEENYYQSENKRAALEDTKSYMTQSLASVAYQINTLAYNFLQLLELQASQLADMESQMNHLHQTVMIHKEKVARREIGVLTASKTTSRQFKLIAPAILEKPIKYVRRPIDYNALDNLGHGVHSPAMSHGQQATAHAQGGTPRSKRGSSQGAIVTSTLQQGPSVGPAPTTKPPTPPQAIRNIGSLSKGSREYRTPPAVAPPQVPSHYAPNYPMGHPRRSIEQNRGVVGLGPGYSTLPVQQSNQLLTHTLPHPHHHSSHHQQRESLSSTSAPGPPQIGMVYPINHGNQSQNHPQTPPPPPPPAGGPLPSSFPLDTHMSMPPPPSPLVHQGAGVEDLTHHLQMMRASQGSPPLPPPPMPESQQLPPSYGYGRTSMGIVPEDAGLPGWVPKNYIEKVVAIYDYYADKEDELSFQENCVIYVLKKNDDGWWEGVMDGITGLFPGNYVEPCV